MSRGGARKGAGRKKGAATRMNEEARAQIAASGLMPLDYLLGLLRDETQKREVRVDAAKAAAPYVHAKLAAATVELSGKDGGPIEMVATDADRVRALMALMARQQAT